MIRYYERDRGQRFRNIIEITILWLRLEYIEFMIWLGIYDYINDIYDYRKQAWLLIFLTAIFFGVLTILTIAVATSIIALNSIGLI